MNRGQGLDGTYVFVERLSFHRDSTYSYVGTSDKHNNPVSTVICALTVGSGMRPLRLTEASRARTLAGGSGEIITTETGSEGAAEYRRKAGQLGTKPQFRH